MKHYFLSCFQCQKFGQFNKDDPTSFRLSEALSLYPQVNLQPTGNVTKTAVGLKGIVPNY